MGNRKVLARMLTLLSAVMMIVVLSAGVAVASEAPVALKKSDRSQQLLDAARKAGVGEGSGLASMGEAPGYISFQSHASGNTYSYAQGANLHVETFATDHYGWGYYFCVIGVWDNVLEDYVDMYDSPTYVDYEEGGYADIDTSGFAVSSGRYEVDAILFDDYYGDVEDIQTFNLDIAAAGPTIPVTRVAGASRFEVAANLARKGWDPTGTKAWAGVTDVIIANGDNGKEADPLSAAGLAGAYDCPVLLVQASNIPVSTRAVVAEIAAKNPGLKVHIIGGTSSVPDARWSDLSKISGVSAVKDRIQGANRYDVSAAIANRIVSVAGTDTVQGVILIAADNSAAFYDALAASPIAFANTMPMLSVRKDGVAPLVSSVLNSEAFAGKPRYAASSSAYIGASLSGATRMTTNSNRYVSAAYISSFAIARNWLVAADTGMAAKLPDALTGGAYMGKTGGVLLFTDSTANIQTATKSFITANKAGITNGWIFGGTGSVPAAQETGFKNLLK